MTAKKTTKTPKTTFDRETATLTEINRELKRLASRKCRAKTADLRKTAEREYKELAAFKTEKFSTTRKSYMTLTDEEIGNLSLEDTIKAIKSLQSRRCIYPEKAQETLQMEVKYTNHKTELVERDLLSKLSDKYNS